MRLREKRVPRREKAGPGSRIRTVKKGVLRAPLGINYRDLYDCGIGG